MFRPDNRRWEASEVRKGGNFLSIYSDRCRCRWKWSTMVSLDSWGHVFTGYVSFRCILVDETSLWKTPAATMDMNMKVKFIFICVSGWLRKHPCNLVTTWFQLFNDTMFDHVQLYKKIWKEIGAFLDFGVRFLSRLKLGACKWTHWQMSSFCKGSFWKKNI